MATNSISRTRATNLTGLIDIDALVEANTIRQKQKIKTTTQNLKIEEYKQKQYREITTKAQKFYDKYFTSTGEKSLVKKDAYNVVKFDSSNSSAVTAIGSSESKIGNYTVNVTEIATKAQYTLSAEDISNGSIIVKNQDGNDCTITITGNNNKEKVENINKQLSENGVNATIQYSDFINNGNGGFVLESKNTGSSESITVKSIGELDYKSVTGKDCVATIKDNSTGLTKTYTGSKNSVTLDGTTFKFNDVTSSSVTLSGKNDTSDLLDKISSFIDDYNDLIGSINTKLYESRDKSYMPLTDEDKEGMTDKQIEEWEKKAQTGLLKNDSYLTKFADDMKLTMSSIIGSDGLNLEKIGIEPVKEYKAKNGLYSVDKEKLKSAIENDPDSIRELFTKNFTETSASTSSKGIMGKLEENLRYHATTQSSKIAELAGLAEGVSSLTSTMTKDITKRKELIQQMQTALKEKEDKLYTKYAKLESNLSALQAQQSSLMSYFQ